LRPVAGSRSPNWNGVGAGAGASVGDGVAASDGVALGSGVGATLGDGVGNTGGEEVGAKLAGTEAGASEGGAEALVGPGVAVGLKLVQLASTIATDAVIAASLRAWERLIELRFIERLATHTTARQGRAYR
jgi:hypothetical protein